jgi:hypothetical protein
MKAEPLADAFQMGVPEARRVEESLERASVEKENWGVSFLPPLDMQ